LIFGLLLRFVPQEFFTAAPGFLIIFQWIVMMNLVLALFNLLPIPPLDGHWILFHFLPRGLEQFKFSLQQYGFLILIFLIFFGGLRWLFSLVMLVYVAITGTLPMELFGYMGGFN